MYIRLMQKTTNSGKVYKHCVYSGRTEMKQFDVLEDAEKWISDNKDNEAMNTLDEVIAQVEEMKMKKYNTFVYSMTDDKEFTSAKATNLLTTDTYTIQKGRNIELDMHIPNRHDGNDWGGLYVNTNINVNGIWHNLGNTGFDGNTMQYNAKTIATYTKKMILKLVEALDLKDEYTVQVELTAKSYSGATKVNTNHEINRIGNNLDSRGAVVDWVKDQNYATVFIKEID